MSDEQQIMSVGINEPEILNSDLSLEIIVQDAEKKVALLQKILTVAIKATNPRDWIDQSGRPSPTASACEKIASVFGIKIELPVPPEGKREERSDNKGSYYTYTFTAKFSIGSRYIHAIGSGSSRDKFFSWNSGDKTWKELSEFDESNIRKSAYSNLILNGITRILGIRNLTWEQLKAGGIKKDSVAQVSYNKGASSDPSSQGLISEAQVKRFHAIATKAGWGQQELKDWLMATYKLDSSAKIPWKQYEAITTAMQKAKGIEPGA